MLYEVITKNNDYLRRFCDDSTKLPLVDVQANINFNTLNYSENNVDDVITDETREDEIKPSQDIINQIERYIKYNYDFSLSKKTAKFSVSEIAKKDSSLEFFYQLPKLNQNKGKLSPAEKGIATHAFMEVADYNKASEDVDAEIHRLVSMGLITKKQGEAINRNALKALFAGEFFDRMKKSIKIMREQQFLVMISELSIDDDDLLAYANTDGMLQGIADCIFEEKDGYVLVDYKTDNVNSVEELTEHYSMQLKLYKLAFDLILDKPVKSRITSYNVCYTKLLREFL